MYEIIFRNPAERFLKKLDKETQKKILEKIKKLKTNPRLGKPLTGSLRGLWRLRHDYYRIIYKIADLELIIYIMNIGPRRNVYN